MRGVTLLTGKALAFSLKLNGLILQFHGRSGSSLADMFLTDNLGACNSFV